MSDTQTFKRPFLKIEVGPKAVKVTEWKWLFMPRKRTFPYSNIAHIEQTALTKKLAIETNAGKRFTYAIGALKSGRLVSLIGNRL